MRTHENKENVIFSSDNLPTTPSHLLKRSQSFMKPLASNSPTKKSGKRLPLASKDNNKSNTLINNGRKNALVNLAPNNSLLHGGKLKRNRPVVSHTGSFINTNTSKPSFPLLPDSRLKKYGSVLGYNGLPRVKSLVLKDVDERKIGKSEEDEEEEEDDDDDEEEEEDNPLAAKLLKALNNHNEDDKEEGSIGLLGSNTGLQQLLKHRNVEEGESSDFEIEIVPPHSEELPHVPNGYSPFKESDVIKLNTFTSPFSMHKEDSDCEECDDHDGLLTISMVKSDDEEQDDDTNDRKRRKSWIDEGLATARHGLLDFNKPELYIEPRYNGEGLDKEDLESLLD